MGLYIIVNSNQIKVWLMNVYTNHHPGAAETPVCELGSATLTTVQAFSFSETWQYSIWLPVVQNPPLFQANVAFKWLDMDVFR